MGKLKWCQEIKLAEGKFKDQKVKSPSTLSLRTKCKIAIQNVKSPQEEKSRTRGILECSPSGEPMVKLKS